MGSRDVCVRTLGCAATGVAPGTALRLEACTQRALLAPGSTRTQDGTLEGQGTRLNGRVYSFYKVHHNAMQKTTGNTNDTLESSTLHSTVPRYCTYQRKFTNLVDEHAVL